MVKFIKNMIQVRLSDESRTKLNICKRVLQKEVANNRGEKWDQDDAFNHVISCFDSDRPENIKINAIFSKIKSEKEAAKQSGIDLSENAIIDQVLNTFEPSIIKDVHSEDGAIIESKTEDNVLYINNDVIEPSDFREEESEELKDE